MAIVWLGFYTIHAFAFRMRFRSQNPSKNLAKTRPEPFKNRCRKRVDFQHRFSKVLASIWESLGPPRRNQVGYFGSPKLLDRPSWAFFSDRSFKNSVLDGSRLNQFWRLWGRFFETFAVFLACCLGDVPPVLQRSLPCWLSWNVKKNWVFAKIMPSHTTSASNRQASTFKFWKPRAPFLADLASILNKRFHAIPFHSIPFHSVPFYSIGIAFHSIPLSFHSVTRCKFSIFLASSVRLASAGCAKRKQYAGVSNPVRVLDPPTRVFLEFETQ